MFFIVKCFEIPALIFITLTCDKIVAAGCPAKAGKNQAKNTNLADSSVLDFLDKVTRRMTFELNTFLFKTIRVYDTLLNLSGHPLMCNSIFKVQFLFL